MYTTGIIVYPCADPQSVADALQRSEHAKQWPLTLIDPSGATGLNTNPDGSAATVRELELRQTTASNLRSGEYSSLFAIDRKLEQLRQPLRRAALKGDEQWTASTGLDRVVVALVPVGADDDTVLDALRQAEQEAQEVIDQYQSDTGIDMCSRPIFLNRPDLLSDVEVSDEDVSYGLRDKVRDSVSGITDRARRSLGKTASRLRKSEGDEGSYTATWLQGSGGEQSTDVGEGQESRMPSVPHQPSAQTTRKAAGQAEDMKRLRADLKKRKQGSTLWSSLNPSNWSRPTGSTLKSWSAWASTYVDPREWYAYMHGEPNPAISVRDRRAISDALSKYIGAHQSCTDRYPVYQYIKSFINTPPSVGSVTFAISSQVPTLTGVEATITAEFEAAKAAYLERQAAEQQAEREAAAAKAKADAKAAAARQREGAAVAAAQEEAAREQPAAAQEPPT